MTGIIAAGRRFAQERRPYWAAAIAAACRDRALLARDPGRMVIATTPDAGMPHPLPWPATGDGRRRPAPNLWE